MNPSSMPIPVDTFLGLLLVASCTAVCVKWIKVPYAVALVLAGLAIGLSRVIPPVQMTPDLVLMIFLPALLFEASWNLDVKALRRDWLAISVLATVGVVVCMFGVAAILHFAVGLKLQTALLFGAMVAATDPVSVIALFRQMGIDKRLTMILEGESLFNDGTAVVLFQLVLGIVLSGGNWSLPASIGKFCLVVFGGALLGTLLGYAASRVTKAFDDHLLEITLTVVTAYGAFLLADRLHVSPVIAVVAAGIVVGNYGSRTGMSATTRMAVNSFWEYAAFLVNSLLFLLIGLQVQWPLLVKYGQVIGFGVLAVVLARLLVVYGICPFVSTKRLPIPDTWRHLLFWGGLRGALSMALALSLPLTYPDREAILNMTFGVVLFTLLLPGLTMGPLVRLLGMEPVKDLLTHYQELKCLMLGYKAELSALRDWKDNGKVSFHTYRIIEQDLERRLCSIQTDLDAFELSDLTVNDLEVRTAKSQLIHVRKGCLKELSEQGMLAEDSLHKLISAIDSEFEVVQEQVQGTQSEQSASQDDQPQSRGREPDSQPATNSDGECDQPANIRNRE